MKGTEWMARHEIEAALKKAAAERGYYKAQAEELLGKLEKAEAQVKQLEAERRSDALWIRFNTFQR